MKYVIAISIFLFAIVCLFRCHKDGLIKPAPIVELNQTINSDTADFTCLPFVYFQNTQRDSDINAHCVSYWQYNPANSEQVVYLLTNGQIWSYNLLTKDRIFLGDNCLFEFDINHKGWVIYNKFDFNVYKVKANGDSLTQVTYDGNDFSPTWDFTDTVIYCFQDYPAFKTLKINAQGKKLDSIPAKGRFMALSKISNKVVFEGPSNGRTGLFIQDLSSLSSTLIAEAYSYFGNFILDNNDEFLYASADSLVFKINLQTHSSEIIYKACPNNVLGSHHISYNSNKMTMVWYKITPLRNYHHCYLHEYRCFEYDLNDPTRKLKEMKFYP